MRTEARGAEAAVALQPVRGRTSSRRTRPRDARSDAVLEELTSRTVELEAGPVGRGRRSFIPFVAWATVVGLIITVGAIGPRVAPPDGRQADPDLGPVASAAAPVTAEELRRGTHLAGSPNPVVLRSPAFGPIVVTSRRVLVEGAINARVGRVDIALEARGNRVLDLSRVAIADSSGGIRPDRSPTFSTSFGLPNPRPNGTMWIVVTAFGPDGLPVAGIRRPFEVGPLLDADPMTPPPRIVDATPINPPERG